MPPLDPERWRRLEPILDAALDLPPEERGDFLERACGGDPELRREVEAWLAECEGSESFLDAAGGAYLAELAESSPYDPSAPARLGSRLGAFRLLDILGQGGMGTVYLAERADGHFEQRVAVKVVNRQGLGSDARERFRFERQILARLEHPNIARLLDGGVDEDGAPYLVMEHVDGVPLDQYCDEHQLGVDARLRLVVEVCRAVSYAHRRQVVHRDLKPSNVLVNRAGEVKLLDFGVAELLVGEGPAASRASSGYRITLGYAAPEILRGETATSSSDLYSLGVLLYQLLTSRLPFPPRRAPFEELVETISSQPPPPPSRLARAAGRGGSLAGRELDAIVLQALAKDPARRPSSAETLADDLERFLDGEPVQALPQTVSYLLSKRFRRHPLSWLAAAAAGLLLVFLAGGWLRSRAQAEQRAEVARSFAQEAERIEWFLRYAQSLPRHDIGRERALMTERLRLLEERTARLGDLAAGPGRFALGRGYAQLDDNDRALAHLEAAWDAGFRTAGAALALGKVLGKLYQKHLDEALRIGDADLRQERIRDLEERYRDRALAFLRQAGSPELESSSYLAGLIAYYDSRYQEAVDRAREADREAPWLHEQHLLEGDAFLGLASRHVERGEYEQAEARFALARQAYGRGQGMAPSDPATYEGSCNVWIHTVDMERLRGHDLGDSFEEGRRACGLALEAHPERPSTLIKVAMLSIFRLQEPRLPPEEVASLLEESRQAARGALLLEPRNAEAYQALGTTFLTKAMLIEMRRGEDPRPDLAQAADAYRQAVALDPGLVTSHANLGTALAVSGGLLLARGEDPRPAFDEAIASYREALDRAPEKVALLNNVGNLLLDKGEFQLRQGIDPAPAFEEALATCRRALELNPRLVAARNLQGALEERLGHLAADRGGDAGRFYTAAMDSFREALAENPAYFRAAINLGSALISSARWRSVSGEDPGRPVEEALEVLARASASDPQNDEETFFNHAEALGLQAQIDALEGRSPRPRLLEAVRVLDAGLAVRPGDRLLRLGRAEVDLLRLQLTGGGLEPAAGGACLEPAKGHLRALLEGGSGDVPARLLLGRLHAACAASAASAEIRREELRAARRALDQVPPEAPSLRRHRTVLAAVVEVLEAPPEETGAARRRLDERIGPDRLQRQRLQAVLAGAPHRDRNEKAASQLSPAPSGPA